MPRISLRLVISGILVWLLLAGTDLRGETAATSQLLQATERRAEALLARPELSAYRGWLKFLRFRAEWENSRAATTNALAQTNLNRFADWVKRIEAHPGVLGTLRGVQEWAYESSVDDSGQPFKLNIPTDYKPSRPPGLVLTLHGATGDHLSAWMAPHPGMFELSVMGRARSAGFVGLSEADVLQALDYVEKHWRVDTNRIHLTGLSMGGFGVGILAADYPHRFASGQMSAGGLTWPANNLLTVPIYARSLISNFSFVSSIISHFF